MTPAARGMIVPACVVVPYVARAIGAFGHGNAWLADFVAGGMPDATLVGACNAALWGSILLASLGLRTRRALWLLTGLVYLAPAYQYATIDLDADDAALGLLLIPILAVPLILPAGLLALILDRRLAPRSSPR